jgi:hypothetical protein
MSQLMNGASGRSESNDQSALSSAFSKMNQREKPNGKSRSEKERQKKNRERNLFMVLR